MCRARFATRRPATAMLAVAAVTLLCSCGAGDMAVAPSPPPARVPDQLVGPTAGGGFVVPTQQLIHPAGQSIEFHGRPLDLALSPDRHTVYVKCDAQLLILDADHWSVRQSLPYPPKLGGSMHGIAASHDGKHVYVTAAQSVLLEASVGDDGKVSWGRQITFARDSYPCGVAVMPGHRRAAVCLSMKNQVVMVDLDAGKVAGEPVAVGVAPYDVAVSPDGARAYVSNWGGRRAREGDTTADSAGTAVVVDDRGVANTGNVGVIDLATGKQVAQIKTGLHPADLELTADGHTLYVANANSDTVSVIDVATAKSRQISLRPDEKLSFGSMSNALAVSGEKVFVANGGNNAVAVVDAAAGTVDGFVPAGWYPSAVVTDGKYIFTANVKGVGSRDPAEKGKWRSRSFRGSITKSDVPLAETLSKYTQQVKADALVPQALAAWEKAQSGAKPLPVPRHVGEPSVFQHVVYVIKENRTYDQVLGDLPRGNSDSSLCVFGRDVTPNHHALAEQFVLLDNYYCNGVISSDGHAWATECVAVDFLEKSIGVSSRSYPVWGNDPLAFSPAGFLWDNALLHGLSFRNYGEMSRSEPKPAGGSRTAILRDYLDKTGKYTFAHDMPIVPLRRVSCPDSPGWNLRIADQIRERHL